MKGIANAGGPGDQAPATSAASNEGSEAWLKDKGRSFKFELACLSFLGIYFPLLPIAWIPQIVEIGLFFVGIVGAMMVAVAVVEDSLRSRGYFEYEIVKYGVGLLVAVAAFLARRVALDDVNFVFHIDPGALPMTVWAGTAINIMGTLMAVFFSAAFISPWILLRNPDKDNPAAAPPLKSWKVRWPVMEGKIIAAILLLASGVGFIYWNFQLNDNGRHQMLYIIARVTDFNSEFTCAGVDTSGTVGLFIGPDQRKVMLAPVFEAGASTLKPLIMPKQEIPKKYPIFECAPIHIDVEEWKKDPNAADGPAATQAAIARAAQ